MSQKRKMPSYVRAGTYMPRKAMRTRGPKSVITRNTRNAFIGPLPRPLPAADRSVPRGMTFHGETKALDLGFGATAPAYAAGALNSTGLVIPLNMIVAGSSFFNRIGRKIEMKSIRVNGVIAQVGAVTRTAPLDYGRIMIVYDRQVNAALPLISDILNNVDQGSNNYSSAAGGGLIGINLNNRDRFLVLADRRIMLPQCTLTAGVISAAFPVDGTQDMIIDDFRKMANLTCHYKADSNPAVIGDIVTGGLYLVTLASNAAGAENWSYQWNSRLRFRDM